MPIKDVADAVEVESRIERFFAAAPSDRAGEIRSLFVEVLDFNLATGEVDIAGATGNVALPASAARIAELDGFHVLYVALDTPNTDRVRKAEVDAAARLIAGQLGDDLLLVFTNRSVSQLHLVLPSFEGTRPVLRRMVVERDLPRRTAVQQVSNIYWRRQDTGSIRVALKAVFDVEAVTKKFFEQYKRVFDRALDLVEGFDRGDTEDEQEQEAERKQLFVQTLFNRLMFVYFLSRKGWLTFQGDNDYLNALWCDYRASPEQTNFYRGRLSRLFFVGLNDPQSRPDPDFGCVRFLNGGLFEETELDQRSGVIVPDGAIKPILTKLFDRFNFTVMESTPFDIEVAVDPEMLGKVFEETVNERNDSGSYYTPRDVVSFMCREALKGYLAGRDTGLTPAAIAKFVDERDTSGITITPSAARRIREALDEVTVVDPACGSGAYLLGMMQELVELQAALDSDCLRTTARDKLHIIQRNLYGVDNDEFAVNIAMLRLWLSLAIEYEGDTPEPLPNLDFKIVCEDSLLGPDPSPESVPDLFRDLVGRLNLGGLKADYMSASDGNAKERLKQEIAVVEGQVRQALGDAGSVDWRLWFAEVFAAHNGFDIVIANPPYIQLQRDGGKLANRYQGVGYKTFVRAGDVYQLFYERGCQLLTPGRGMLAYITSNSWLKAKYGERQRRYFAEQHTPLRLLDLGKDTFESAIVDTCVLLVREGGAAETFAAVDMDGLADKDVPPREELWGGTTPNGAAPWSILSRSEQRVLEKMRAVGMPLGDWDVTTYRGVVTGYNEAFIIDDTTRQALIDEDPSSAEILKPILRGRDIHRYQAQWANLWLISTPPSLELNIDRYSAIKEHLVSFGKDRLEQSGNALVGGGKSRKRTPHAWFELQDSCSYHEEFSKEKLFWMDLTEQGRFAYDEGEMFCVNTVFMMTGKSIKYLCSILNSSLTTWFMKNTALTSGMGVTRWFKITVETIPIPMILADKQRPFIRLVERILVAKASDPDADTSAQEAEIDRLVYELYDLTDEEVAAVEAG